MSNKLQYETSPYLLQHKENPVEWYPWCKEAFSRAKEEDKPVFLSIGYSTCHWCHVMAHESFEDAETAEILNRHFVCIKVDKEERPLLFDSNTIIKYLSEPTEEYPLKNGKTTYYVCKSHSCLPPVNDLNDLS